MTGRIHPVIITRPCNCGSQGSTSILRSPYKWGLLINGGLTKLIENLLLKWDGGRGYKPVRKLREGPTY